MFRIFLWVYNVGVPLTAFMMVVRGITEVKEISLSVAANSAVSGIAGIGHIMTGLGIILLLLSLKFEAVIIQNGDMDAAYIEVPYDKSNY